VDHQPIPVSARHLPAASAATCLPGRAPDPVSLRESLEGLLTDPRKPRGKRHPLPSLVSVMVAGVASGHGGAQAVAQAAADWDQDVLAGHGCRISPRTGLRVPPSASMLDRLPRLLDADEFEAALSACLAQAALDPAIPAAPARPVTRANAAAGPSPADLHPERGRGAGARHRPTARPQPANRPRLPAPAQDTRNQGRLAAGPVHRRLRRLLPPAVRRGPGPAAQQPVPRAARTRLPGKPLDLLPRADPSAAVPTRPSAIPGARANTARPVRDLPPSRPRAPACADLIGMCGKRPAGGRKPGTRTGSEAGGREIRSV
jgi:hypothetical protein